MKRHAHLKSTVDGVVGMDGTTGPTEGDGYSSNG